MGGRAGFVLPEPELGTCRHETDRSARLKLATHLQPAFHQAFLAAPGPSPALGLSDIPTEGQVRSTLVNCPHRGFPSVPCSRLSPLWAGD